MNKNRRFKKLTISLAVSMMFTAPAMAQLSTSTIKGVITQAGTPATTALEIIAKNTATGFTYKAKSDGQGNYILNGLSPGSYELAISGSNGKPQLVTVAVGETAALNLALSASSSTEPQTITVVGIGQRSGVIDSQVGTSVSRQQIENLPQITRNFMSFADLAPGVRFSVDPATGYTTLQSGAQNQDNVNVFIDGVSQKNDILRGGMSGMDSSRGNPFPQSAIAEYKVISQNYKAEFDKVSSVAITAVTKSGTNELHGDVFWDHTGSSYTAETPFDKVNVANGDKLPSWKQDEYGFTLGGPIKEDVAHFFISYEGKDIGQPRTFGLANVTGQLPNTGMAASFWPQQGTVVQKFNEDLLFAKIDLQINSSQRLEISTRYRK